MVSTKRGRISYTWTAALSETLDNPNIVYGMYVVLVP